MLAELVEGGGADHAQLAARQHRLDHVAGVHGALGRAGPDDGVHLVDEGDDLALGVGDLLQHGLEPLLELTAVLGPGHHRADVEGDQALVAQALGDVALDDAAGEPLDDGGLADAGLADEHRVVLRPSRQDLDHPADLVVAPDDRIDLALARRLGEVAPVLLEGLVLLLGVLAGDAVAPSHLLERLQQLFAGDAHLVGEREQQVLGRQVLVVEVLAELVGLVEQLVGGLPEAGLAPVGLGQLLDGVGHLVAHGQRRLADLLQDRQHHALLLAEQGGEEVVGGDLGVAGGARQLDGGVERLLGLEGPAVGIEGHGGTEPPSGGDRGDSVAHSRRPPTRSACGRCRKLDNECSKFGPENIPDRALPRPRPAGDGGRPSVAGRSGGPQRGEGGAQRR